MGFAHLLDSFAGLRALVVGDVMLDEYVLGEVERISPEAPVMVVRKRSSRWVPGGAANVAANIVALGGSASLVGVVGEDEGGRLLQGALSGGAVESALVTCGGRVTTRKTRVVANHSHQVLRIDEETEEELAGGEEERVLSAVAAALEGVDVLVVSDYLKGLLTERVVSGLVGAGRERGVPVVANVKPRSAARYRGASLVSLNRGEVAALVGRRPSGRVEGLEVAGAARCVLGVDCALVTLGESGLVADWGSGSASVAGVEVEAYDVAGAGDTVLATVALGLAAVGFEPEVFALAAQTSARVVQHVGVAVPDGRDLELIRGL